MKRDTRLFRWLFTRLGTLGWGIVLAWALLGLLELSGLGTYWVHTIISSRLSALGGELHLGEADFQWLEPGLVLNDLSLVTDEEVLAAEHLHVRFGWQGGFGLAPNRVHLRGARVVLGPSLANGIRGLLDMPKLDPEERDQDEGLPKLPEVLVEDLTVLVETSTGEQVEVLHVDLSLDAASGQPEVIGRVHTPRQRAEGAPGSILLSGGVDADGVLNLRGQAVGLEIKPEDIPNVPELMFLRGWEPRGTLDLEARVVVDLLQELAPKADFTGRFEGASLLPPGALRPVEDLELLYTLTFNPDDEEWLWDTTAWEGVASASGEFAGETFQAGALLGDTARDDSHFEAWIELDTIDLSTPLDQLAEESRWFDDLHVAASPAGAFSAKISTRLPRVREGEEALPPKPEMLVHVDVEEGTRLTYYGWPTRNPEVEPLGFPVPTSVARGEITYAYTRRLARRAITHINLDLEHASGPTEVRYLNWSAPIDTPPFASGTETHLAIMVPRLDVNDELRRAIAGLDSILGEGEIWRKYAPTGGSLGVDLYLARTPGFSRPGVRVNLDVNEVGCTVATFPVPVRSATGWIQLVSDHDGEFGASWSLSSTSGSPEFRVTGRDRSRKAEVEDKRERLLSTIDLRAWHVDVNGPILGALREETREGLEELVLEGEVSAHLATYSSKGLRRGLELQPEPGLSAAPTGFPERIDDLSGTFRLAWNDAGPEGVVETLSWVPGVEGVGPGEERVVFHGSGSREGWSGSVFATGVSASHWNASDALSTAGDGEFELTLEGVVDLEATVSRPAPKGERPATAPAGELNAKLDVVLRSNTLMDGSDALLEELEGTFVMTGRHITSPLIEGRLEETSVILEDLDLLSDDEALNLSTQIRASGIPLDMAHMDTLLDEEMLTSLVEELGLRGTVDVDHGTVVVHVPREGSRSVRFRGDLTLTDMALEAGLPIIVQSARAEVRELIVEDGELRGWGRILNLYGNCFESELGPVSALVSYVGGVLTVEDFSGSFERGKIHPLDRDAGPFVATRGRPAVRVVLSPPFPYQASIAVDNVDAARWLEGISSDAVTSAGTLSVEADLEGNLGTLVSTRARGWIHLERSRLWSIPLFRELLREFGLDHTVMFDEVRFDFDLSDEVITMENLELRSPLLQLVGEGTLDMEGRLNHELEVHYSIVDKITPFRRLFYLVQNIFVSVSIRGDLSGPIVRLKNGLVSVFRGEPEIEPSLPLPGLSPLPRRF